MSIEYLIKKTGQGIIPPSVQEVPPVGIEPTISGFGIPEPYPKAGAMIGNNYTQNLVSCKTEAQGFVLSKGSL